MTQHFVEFPGSLGTLRGVWHMPVSATPVPAVILLHGFTGTKAEHQFLFVETARRLTVEGIAVLRADFYGSGDSDGVFSDMTLFTERDDAQRMFTFAAAQPGIDAARVGVLGYSMGGTVSALLTAKEPRIRALVTWAPPLTMSIADMLRLMPQPAVGGLKIGDGFIRSCHEAKTLDALSGFDRPTVVLYGSEDQSVKLSDAAAFADKVSGRLSVIEGADHHFNSVEWRETLISASVRHFVDLLL